MDKEYKELMQISIIGENEELSKMVQDIMPSQEKEEITFKEFMEEFLAEEERKENAKESFSIVVYKKENPILKFFKEIKNIFEKIGIIKSSKELTYSKNEKGI